MNRLLAIVVAAIGVYYLATQYPELLEGLDLPSMNFGGGGHGVMHR